MNTEFGDAVVAGLSGKVKWIPSKFHYDEKGSKLFQEIMGLAEYYPTRCELQILSTHGPTILDALNFKQNFNVVELGCGDGLKTLELLKAFDSAGAEFIYVPVDICGDAVATSVERMRSNLPSLRIEPLVGDFFDILEELRLKDTQSLYLFFGGSLGNLSWEESMDFLGRIWKRMAPRDKVVIGFDLQKCPEVISKAYNDSQGVTKAFNMNLLERIRTELDADLDLVNFDSCSSYNVKNGEIRTHLVSLCPQTFTSKALNKNFALENGERIFVEISRKFTLEEIKRLAKSLRFKVLENLMDEQNYYVVSMWEKEAKLL